MEEIILYNLDSFINAKFDEKLNVVEKILESIRGYL